MSWQTDPFWKDVDVGSPKQCWSHRTAPSRSRYRKAYEVFSGKRPGVVVHSCGNRQCVNPAHMKAWDSRAEYAAEKRYLKRYDNTKLNEYDLQCIEHWYSLGISQVFIAAVVGVHYNYMWKLLAGKRGWKRNRNNDW